MTSTIRNRILHLSLTLCLVLTAACGDEADPADDNAEENASSNSSANSSANSDVNSSSNGDANSSSNNSTMDASCADVCSAIGTCEGVMNCASVCDQSFNQALRNCLAGAGTCADADACIENPNPNNMGNNSNNTEGAEGSECNINEDCNSNFCLRSPGAIDGTCAKNDFGEMCTVGMGGDDCLYKGCLFSEGDDFGYCTRVCDDDFACPSFWSCKEVGNAASKYCVQD